MGCSKNRVSVRVRFGGSARLCSVAICTLSAICIPSLLGQAASIDKAEVLKGNTVRIKGVTEGFGFIVAQSGNQVYIVTARHVVVKDSPDSPPATSAQVTFYSDQGKPYKAEVLQTHVGDVAVLRVSPPQQLTWVRECVAANDKSNRGTAVVFVGKHGQWYVPAAPGVIGSEQPSNESQIEIDGLPVSPGTSGAPLIADSGIVGMIQQDSAEDTRAITIDFIQRAFANWNLPWGLRPGTPTNSCLDGDWKEQYDNPMIWSFAVHGDTLKIMRLDNFVSGEFTKKEKSYVGELHWGNGDTWKNVILTPTDDCSQVRTNQSWWYHR